MSKVGQIERATQNRIAQLFQQQLKYRYLGNLEKEEENSDQSQLPVASSKLPVPKNQSPVSRKPLPTATENLKLVRYSDRAVALSGDTRQLKDKLKELWGSYNPNLKINGQSVKGWVFSAKREPQLRQLIAS